MRRKATLWWDGWEREKDRKIGYFKDENHLDDKAKGEGEGDDNKEDWGEDEEVGAHLWIEFRAYVEDGDDDGGGGDEVKPVVALLETTRSTRASVQEGKAGQCSL